MKGKELYRSRENRIVGGVCGGVGEFLETDPTIIRLTLAVVTILAPWVGVAGYLVAWIIIPEKSAYRKYAKKKKR